MFFSSSFDFFDICLSFCDILLELQPWKDKLRKYFPRRPRPIIALAPPGEFWCFVRLGKKRKWKNDFSEKQEWYTLFESKSYVDYKLEVFSMVFLCVKIKNNKFLLTFCTVLGSKYLKKIYWFEKILCIFRNLFRIPSNS